MLKGTAGRFQWEFTQTLLFYAELQMLYNWITNPHTIKPIIQISILGLLLTKKTSLLSTKANSKNEQLLDQIYLTFFNENYDIKIINLW